MAPEIDTEELLTSEKSDIYVIPNPDSIGQFLVVPGTFGVPEDGKKIWIRNVTDKRVEVTFQSSIGGAKGIDQKKSEDFDLKKADVGVYEYKVAVLIEGGPPVLAQGGSNPRIVYG